MCEKLLADDAGDVVRAVLAAARKGDMAACKLVLDRVVPARKGRPLTLDLPHIASAADVVAAMSAIMAAIADGTITADEAGAVAAVIEVARRSIETCQIEERLARLEAAAR